MPGEMGRKILGPLGEEPSSMLVLGPLFGHIIIGFGQEDIDFGFQKDLTEFPGVLGDRGKTRI